MIHEFIVEHSVAVSLIAIIVILLEIWLHLYLLQREDKRSKCVQKSAFDKNQIVLPYSKEQQQQLLQQSTQLLHTIFFRC